MMKDFRRKLMQIANRLVGRDYIRSCAMSTAWKLISVKLVREPENIHDRNAVAVVAEVRGKVKAMLGYLPQAVAAVVAAMMDKGLTITGKQLRITGGYGVFENYGARITVTM